MRTSHYEHLDGFNNVTIQCDVRSAGLEQVAFRWIIKCDEFIYKSRLHNNWTDQIWNRAKNMYYKEVKRDI
jgi:hypothetical protein